jgi:hypothetical protein
MLARIVWGSSRHYARLVLTALGFVWTLPNTLLGVLGPLFLPVYGALYLRYGYERHPFELAVVRMAGR